MKIGTTIRDFRLQHGLSQGDIEKRTGLLRCYLSRVENGHTIPSLLTQIRRYSSSLNESDKKLLLAMVKKFASAAVPAVV